MMSMMLKSLWLLLLWLWISVWVVKFDSVHWKPVFACTVSIYEFIIVYQILLKMNYWFFSQNISSVFSLFSFLTKFWSNKYFFLDNFFNFLHWYDYWLKKIWITNLHVLEYSWSGIHVTIFVLRICTPLCTRLNMNQTFVLIH